MVEATLKLKITRTNYATRKKPSNNIAGYNIASNKASEVSWVMKK